MSGAVSDSIQNLMPILDAGFKKAIADSDSQLHRKYVSFRWVGMITELVHNFFTGD